MTREDVYKAIDGERDYQDAKFGKLDDPNYVSYFPAQFIIDIEIHLQQAKEANYELSQERTMDQLRKIAALCVKCGEVHGMPERSLVK